MPRILSLPSGGLLNLDDLPKEATLEMLEVCAARIRELEHGHNSAKIPTPQRKRARIEPTPVPMDASVKPLSAGDAKAIVDELKAKLKAKKFFPGSQAEPCSVTFSSPRFPVEVARQLLGPSTTGKGTRSFQGRQIDCLLRLKPGALKATLYKKPHRFSKPGATAKKCGTAPLKFLTMELSYKASNLCGKLRCINDRCAHEVESAAFLAGIRARHLLDAGPEEKQEYLAAMSPEEKADVENLKMHPAFLKEMEKQLRLEDSLDVEAEGDME
mmetsp:Transcript_63431/g.112768  ORF Transcript_63431/g.112768 Transcript_63431/m.112768 type:complete len:271 (+) Transcript_63431:46-858(+)